MLEFPPDNGRVARLVALVTLAAILCVPLAASARRSPETAAAPGWELHAARATAAPHAPGRLLVKFRAPLDATLKSESPALQTLLGEGLQRARPLLRRAPPAQPAAAGVDRLYEIEVPAGTSIPLLAAKLSRLDAVEYAEPVYLYDLVGDNDAILASPNDPQYGDSLQHYLGVMQVEAAWDVVKGEDGSPVVCVVDGGTDWEHEDLLANMWENPGEIPDNMIDDDGNDYVDDYHGWNFQADNGNPRGDNDQTPSSANHGTHTGGLLAVVTDNGVGIASASWNPRLMAVNAAGTNGGSIAYGYDGIIYAAENGADIVSLSWGSFSASQAMQDIIDFAVSQGVLVIGAAGNNNSSTPFYPAAYRNVYAVANVWGHDPDPDDGIDHVDQRYGTGSASNYGGWLDVAAAGTSVYSTFDFGRTDQYGFSTGTSMSAPVAAAVAALIQSQNPSWGPLKVGEQLRITCDNINAKNPGFEDLLGKGRVNALRAVTEASPAVRAVSWTFSDPDGNGEINQGETLVMSIDVHNYHDDAVGLAFTLSVDSPWLTVSDSTASAGTLAEDAGASLANAFTFTVDANAPPGTELDLRIDMTANSYDDFQWVPIVLEPIIETHDINNLEVTLTSSGNIGWVGFAGGLGPNGEGFRFHEGPNLLFEGALMLGTSADNLSDAARFTGPRTDFAPADNQGPTKTTPGATSDQEIQAPYDDSSNSATPLGVRVDLQTRAYAGAPNDDFLFLGFEITNTGVSDLGGLWVGLFFDWDIDEDHFATNQVSWDASRRLGYAWDASEPSLPYAGVTALSGSQVGYSAIRNDGGGGQPINLYNAFTKGEKWLCLNGGTGNLDAGPFDISNAISAGPYLLAPGDSAIVWFALLAGDDLVDLQANSDAAWVLFADSVQTSVEEERPDIGAAPPPQLRLGTPVPNPFNPGTTIELQVDRPRPVFVGIYDVRGRLVRALVDRVEQPGIRSIVWDGLDRNGSPVSSGVYFARLRSERQMLARRLILAR
jgi:subtilisin family serine protease